MKRIIVEKRDIKGWIEVNPSNLCVKASDSMRWTVGSDYMVIESKLRSDKWKISKK